MNVDVDAVVAVLTMAAMLLLAYTYVGYPALLWLVRKITGPPATDERTPARWPSVTVVISAHNEAAVIGRRIQNLLDQQYPKDRLHILIGLDGSNDGTAEYLARRRFPRTEWLAFPQRRGKASVLNDLVARAKGEYLVFSDAATVFYPDAVRELIGGFVRYPGAAVIGGRLELRSSERSKNLDGLYWRYEMFLKTHESEIGAGLGVSGAIYAVRRAHFQPLPTETMADDLLQPLLIRLRTHGDVVLHMGACAWQLTPQRVTDEFRRRVRTGAGILHALSHARPLLSPGWGTVAVALWSHKVLRLLGPWLLCAALAGSVWLADRPVFLFLLTAQLGLYALSLAAGALTAVPIVGRAGVAARYFVALNAALVLGSWKYFSGTASPAWNRTPRPAEPATTGPVWAPSESPDTAREERPAA